VLYCQGLKVLIGRITASITPGSLVAALRTERVLAGSPLPPLLANFMYLQAATMRRFAARARPVSDYAMNGEARIFAHCWTDLCAFVASGAAARRR
jgi:hypothetical protein